MKKATKKAKRAVPQERFATIGIYSGRIYRVFSAETKLALARKQCIYAGERLARVEIREVTR